MSLSAQTCHYVSPLMTGIDIALLLQTSLRPQLRTGNQVLWELNQALKESQRAQGAPTGDSVTIKTRQAIPLLSSPIFTRRGINYLIPLV